MLQLKLFFLQFKKYKSIWLCFLIHIFSDHSSNAVFFLSQTDSHQIQNLTSFLASNSLSPITVEKNSDYNKILDKQNEISVNSTSFQDHDQEEGSVSENLTNEVNDVPSTSGIDKQEKVKIFIVYIFSLKLLNLF